MQKLKMQKLKMQQLVIILTIVLTLSYMMWHMMRGHKVPTLILIPNNHVTLKYCKNFLSENFCDTIIKKMDDKKFVKSSITFGDDDFCTSKTTSLPSTAPLAKILNEKICDILQIDPMYGEELQIHKYDRHDQFKDHTDYFSKDVEVEMDHIKQNGQRTWTFMIYLNDVEKGGHTDFKLLNLSIKPEKGMALAWYNLKEDSEIEGNHYTVHAELPVEAGNKYVITKWFKSNSV